jgi:membrane-bound lytic murein transglycosylase F
VLVQRSRKGSPKLKGPEQLRGKRVHVRASSSYRQSLEALQAKYGPFEIVPVAEELETEQIVAMVGRGEAELTVADSHILQVELAYRGDVEAAFKLPRPEADLRREIAFAVRPDNPKLKGLLDGFVRRTYRSLEYNMWAKKYFENKRSISQAKEGLRQGGVISPYDRHFKQYARRYGFDWRLMAAQAYQESRFDPKAKSWVGARGLFQVMPSTGRELGFANLEDPEAGTHAGILYMHRLVRRIDPRIPFKQRVRFALAAYNVGLGHVLDAQRLAGELGLDPHRWFGHVEKAMLLLAEPRHHSRSRHGYCRGEEPVRYVSEIQNRYDHYVRLVPEG